MFWLLRGLKCGRLAATSGGLVWMLFGYSAVWFAHSVLTAALVFIPLAMLWIRRGLEERRLSFAALAGFALGMTILGSHPQHALHSFVFLLVWAASSRKRFAIGFSALFTIISIGIGMAAILTRLET